MMCEDFGGSFSSSSSRSAGYYEKLYKMEKSEKDILQKKNSELELKVTNLEEQIEKSIKKSCEVIF